MSTLSNRGEFIGQIMDLFDDFLEKRGIRIDSCDKQMQEDGYIPCEDNTAVLYGDDYGSLYDSVEKVLDLWGKLPAIEESENPKIVLEVPKKNKRIVLVDNVSENIQPSDVIVCPGHIVSKKWTILDVAYMLEESGHKPT